MPLPPQLNNDIELVSVDPEPKLREVITIQEAALLTGMSRTAIFAQIGKSIRGRRSITGGDWMLLFEDVEKVYTIKKEHLLWLVG